MQPKIYRNIFNIQVNSSLVISKQKAIANMWNYSIHSKWPRQCGKGSQQSPININTNLVVNNKNIPMLRFENVDKKVDAIVKNNGYTVVITIPYKQRVTVSGGGLKKNYVFHNLHFHWPSEHQVNKKYSDLEAHLVFYASDCQNIDEALRHKKGIVAIGMLFNKTENASSKAFSCLFKAMQIVSRKKDNHAKINLTLQELLPNMEEGFYTYDGSLTTPEFNEVVTWFILKDIGRISPNQYGALTTIYDGNNRLLKSNNRKVQPLNGRKVYFSSSKSLTDKCNI